MNSCCQVSSGGYVKGRDIPNEWKQKQLMAESSFESETNTNIFFVLCPLVFFALFYSTSDYYLYSSRDK